MLVLKLRVGEKKGEGEGYFLIIIAKIICLKNGPKGRKFLGFLGCAKSDVRNSMCELTTYFWRVDRTRNKKPIACGLRNLFNTDYGFLGLISDCA